MASAGALADKTGHGRSPLCGFVNCEAQDRSGGAGGQQARRPGAIRPPPPCRARRHAAMHEDAGKPSAAFPQARRRKTGPASKRQETKALQAKGRSDSFPRRRRNLKGAIPAQPQQGTRVGRLAKKRPVIVLWRQPHDSSTACGRTEEISPRFAGESKATKPQPKKEGLSPGPRTYECASG